MTRYDELSHLLDTCDECSREFPMSELTYYGKHEELAFCDNCEKK